MAKMLDEWVETEVRPLRDQPMSYMSQYHFFRDPSRPIYADPSCFLAPADGVLLYQQVVEPDEQLVDIKSKPYTLRSAMRDQTFDQRSLVVGIFMTFFDVHVNRIPYPGLLSWTLLDPIETLNRPMLDVERGILDDLCISFDRADYLHANQRVINRVDSHLLPGPYYILQIADYDVDSITPFELKQRQPVDQGHRFSTIRYGSQVDLVIPVYDGTDLETIQVTGCHVEAGVDPVVRIRQRED